MKHIIILSGHSKRFLDEGYPIKPLIKINSKTIIEHVVETVKPLNFCDITFIAKIEDQQRYQIKDFLEDTFKGCEILLIQGHLLGPVYSVLSSGIKLEPTKEVLVTYCDLYIKWDVHEFYKFLRDNSPDGCIVSHVGWHPHRIYNNSFAYLRVEGEKVLEIKEKQCFSDNPIAEFASGGIYYFKTASSMLYYFNYIVQNEIKVNNEYYVTLPYNPMIQDGLNILHYDSKQYVCLGTPKDVEIYKSIVTLSNHLSGSISDISSCVEYFLKES